MSFVDFLEENWSASGTLEEKPPFARVEDFYDRHICSRNVVSSCIALCQFRGRLEEGLSKPEDFEIERLDVYVQVGIASRVVAPAIAVD